MFCELKFLAYRNEVLVGRMPATLLNEILTITTAMKFSSKPEKKLRQQYAKGCDKQLLELLRKKNEELEKAWQRIKKKSVPLPSFLR
jgi:hypothetical protein